MGISKRLSLRNSDSAGPDKTWSLKDFVAKLKKKREKEVDNVLVVGIDFGTTYSGAAWATITDFETDDIHLITSWPGCGCEEGKAPTELFYEQGNVTWGFNIHNDAEPIRWFKLLLLRDEDLPQELRDAEYVLRARKVLRELKKTPVELTADYLRCLWKHVVQSIEKERGKSVVDGFAFHVVLTVPAIWKNYARQAMEEAARKAGILDSRMAGPTFLSFAPEPEAAALATICEPGRVIQSNDTYIICDAGGGGLCGGIFVDEAFEAICKERLGRNWSRLSQSSIKMIMKKQWETDIKSQFRVEGNKSKDYIVVIPHEAFPVGSLDDTSRYPIVKDGKIFFRSSDIQSAFSDVFSKIEKLVDEQIKKAKESHLRVTGIIMVGGLGSSPYLFDHLNASRTSICRGAIFKGFLDGPGQSTADTSIPFERAPKMHSISVVSTIARQSLGVSMNERFDKKRHIKEDRYWDKEEDAYFANNQMSWYLFKGQDVPKQQPVRHTFYQLYGNEDEYNEISKAYKCKILQNDEDMPSTRRTSSVKELCIITVELPKPFSELEDWINPKGVKFKKLEFDVEMVPSGASCDFSIYYGDEKLGSQQASVEFD
ncbi:hsp70 family chaperone [Colletotrichum incanum]|uniref:Hsp70 family chaperone n=1 Tax=Colletotrichum incanum TaxID=1573173 RepID=A0A167DU34_COLIC|nr:hsp70 family chaperone [Colletotrichum incanum]